MTPRHLRALRRAHKAVDRLQAHLSPDVQARLVFVPKGASVVIASDTDHPHPGGSPDDHDRP